MLCLRAFSANAQPGRTCFRWTAIARVGDSADGQTPPNLWYFLHDGARDGRGYFVGYHSQSKLCVGFIGRDGFRPDQPPVEQWFPMDGAKLACIRHSPTRLRVLATITTMPADSPAWKVDMISGTQLLEVDLRSGSVTTLMESPDLIAVGMLETASPSKAAMMAGSAIRRRSASRPSAQHLAVRTTDRVIVFDASEKQRTALHASRSVPRPKNQLVPT